MQLAAFSQDQTRNAWTPLLEMLREGPVIDAYDIEPLDSFVNLPRGRIEYVTSAATSREGNRPTFAVLDQTESWLPDSGGVRLAAAIRRNLGKTGGASVEAPNAYRPGAESVVEASAEYARAIAEGRTRDAGLLHDHREAPPDTDLADHDSLLAGLAYAYGDSAEQAGGWVDLSRIAAEVWDPATDPADARAYFLNQVTHATDAWLSQPEWAACAAPSTVVTAGSMITLGFDGSRKRSRGVADATALIGCRLDDGHLFEIAVWEQPDGPAGADWQIPRTEVNAAVRQAFDRYTVVGFYADPSKWEETITSWVAAYGPQLKVRNSRDHPIEWWMSGGRSIHMVRAVERLENVVLARQVTHCGSHAFTRHVLNARRRAGRAGIQLAKPHPESPRKIDAAIAAVLAFEARADAVAAGITARPAAMGGWTF